MLGLFVPLAVGRKWALPGCQFEFDFIWMRQGSPVEKPIADDVPEDHPRFGTLRLGLGLLRLFPILQQDKILRSEFQVGLPRLEESVEIRKNAKRIGEG